MTHKHHWIFPPADGPTSTGKCECGATIECWNTIDKAPLKLVHPKLLEAKGLRRTIALEQFLNKETYYGMFFTRE